MATGMTAKQVLDQRLALALGQGAPDDISDAYRALADFHFEERNMAAADELYSFSALHAGASASSRSVSSRTASPRSRVSPPTTLSVTVLEAQNLASLSAGESAADAALFCTVSLEWPGKASVAARTESVPFADTLKWNARFEFRVEDAAVREGQINVVIMSRRASSSPGHGSRGAPQGEPADAAAVRIGVIRAIPLAHVSARSGTLQRWFTVTPPPEQRAAVRVAEAQKCQLALVLRTSDTQITVAGNASAAFDFSPVLATPSPRSAGSASAGRLSNTLGLHGAQQSSVDASQHGSTPGTPQPAELPQPAHVLGRGARRQQALTPGHTRSTTEDKTRVVSPQAPANRSHAASDKFEGPAVLVLTLAGDVDELSKAPEHRRAFQAQLVDDLAAALGLGRRQFLVFSLRPPRLTVTLGVLVPVGGPTARQLGAELARQLGDIGSTLMRGHVTRRTTKVQHVDDSGGAGPVESFRVGQASTDPVVITSSMPPVMKSPMPVVQSPMKSATPPVVFQKAPAAMSADRSSPSTFPRSSRPRSPQMKVPSANQGPRHAEEVGPDSELASILSARKRQIDQAPRSRRASPVDTAAGTGSGQTLCPPDASDRGFPPLHAIGSGADMTCEGLGLLAPANMSHSMYDKIDSPGDNAASPSLGLGPVKYVWDQDSGRGGSGDQIADEGERSPVKSQMQRALEEGRLKYSRKAADLRPAKVFDFTSNPSGVRLPPAPRAASAEAADCRSDVGTLDASRLPGSRTGEQTRASPLNPVAMQLPQKWRHASIALVVHGAIADAPSFGEVELVEDAILIVSKTGSVSLVSASAATEEPDMLSWVQRFTAGACTTVLCGDDEQDTVEVMRLARGQVLVPGMIDTHIHAPQYSYTGTATDKPLMEWLKHYTFPSERNLADPEIAARVYALVVDRLLASGTTTALYFATIHLSASKILADIAVERGQRAFVGKVCMDRNAPEDYVETTAESLAGTEEFIKYVRGLGTELVQPVITPRFIPTCTPELLRGLGALARKYDCHVQSHISESHDEMAFVSALHPSEGSDADIFDRHGLLTSKCVMAHGVHINREDADLLRQRGVAVAHCPLSNFFFGDGTLATAKLVDLGNKVGLGTDVAGGSCPCMLSAVRNAVIADRCVRHGARHSLDLLSSPSQHPSVDRTAASTVTPSGVSARKQGWEGMPMPEAMDWRHAFYLATTGGAQALGIEDHVGTFDVGKSFDALLLDVAGGSIDLFDTDSSRDILEKLFNLGTEHNVSKVWVRGRCVHWRDKQQTDSSPQRSRVPAPSANVQVASPPLQKDASAADEQRTSPKQPRMSRQSSLIEPATLPQQLTSSLPAPFPILGSPIEETGNSGKSALSALGNIKAFERGYPPLHLHGTHASDSSTPAGNGDERVRPASSQLVNQEISSMHLTQQDKSAHELSYERSSSKSGAETSQTQQSSGMYSPRSPPEPIFPAPSHVAGKNSLFDSEALADQDEVGAC